MLMWKMDQAEGQLLTLLEGCVVGRMTEILNVEDMIGGGMCEGITRLAEDRAR